MKTLAPLVLFLAVGLQACSAGTRDSKGSTPDSTALAAAVPVRVAEVIDTTLTETVTGPGRTQALKQTRVRAPFAGTLLSLRVADGDRVAASQVVGTMISRNSAAARTGARAMLEAARTPEESSDARRAVEIAAQNLVAAPLRAPEPGVVIAHAAGEGDLVNEGDDIVTIAVAGSLAFVAQVVQSDLPRVRSGQAATIELAARTEPLRGVVHAVLTAASSENLSASVRLDFIGGDAPVEVGLFGTAHIAVGVRPHAIVVPAAALLRDDVYGTSRVAVVGEDGRAQWVEVTPGLTVDSLVEITAPPLAVKARVIVSGQVGLPDSAHVRVEP
jgi:multidrug efflux pump subunit AcrA (membrane-fusion protein)